MNRAEEQEGWRKMNEQIHTDNLEDQRDTEREEEDRQREGEREEEEEMKMELGEIKCLLRTRGGERKKRKQLQKAQTKFRPHLK